MLLMSSVEKSVMYILIFPNKLGGDAFSCKFIQGKGSRAVCGGVCGKICQIMHNCSIVALVSTSRSVLRGH